MGFKTQVCRTFNAAVMSTLMLGLVFEMAHALEEPPQPHTDQHERVEHKMIRLREAESNRPQLKAILSSNGHKPPCLDWPDWAKAGAKVN